MAGQLFNPNSRQWSNQFTLTAGRLVSRRSCITPAAIIILLNNRSFTAHPSETCTILYSGWFNRLDPHEETREDWRNMPGLGTYFFLLVRGKRDHLYGATNRMYATARLCMRRCVFSISTDDSWEFNRFGAQVCVQFSFLAKNASRDIDAMATLP